MNETQTEPLHANPSVSGTILSFEMGLLWPDMMSHYGQVIGLLFALKGIAFFVEAIFRASSTPGTGYHRVGICSPVF